MSVKLYDITGCVIMVQSNHPACMSYERKNHTLEKRFHVFDDHGVLACHFTFFPYTYSFSQIKIGGNVTPQSR